MAARRNVSPGGTIGRGTDTIEQHLSSWDRAVENVCEEFADFGFMDDEDDDDEPEGLWHQASNVSGLHTLTPAPPRYSVMDNNPQNISNNANPFGDSIPPINERPIVPQRSARNPTTNGTVETVTRPQSEQVLIHFNNDRIKVKSKMSSPDASNVLDTNNSQSNAKDLPVSTSPDTYTQSPTSNLQNNGQPKYNLVSTGSVSSISSDLNSSSGSLAFSDFNLDDPQYFNAESNPVPPVRTVQSFDSSLDNLSAVERTLEKLSSWPLNEAPRANNSAASLDSMNNSGLEPSEELGAVGGAGGAGSQQVTSPLSAEEKSGDGNLTIQVGEDKKDSERMPSEPPPSYEEAMRNMPILQSSPQRNSQAQQQNRLSWQPPAQGYNGENRLSWQPPNDQLSYQQQPPSYQHQLQRPLSYHSQASLGSVDSGRLLCYPPEPDAPGYVHNKDFHPEFQNGITEKFDMLVAKANSWLMQNVNARVLHCESPLYFSAYSLGFSSSRVISTKSKQYNEPTMAVRFLRIWYRMIDLCPEEDQLLPPHQLSYRNFTNPVDGSTVLSLMKAANRTMAQGLQGQVLCMETIYTLAACLHQPDICCWVERYQDKKPYAFFMRLFLLDDPELAEGQIEMMDFIPVPTTRSMPHDFEPFTALIDSMRNWLHSRQNVHVLNVQSFYVKWKPIRLDFWQRVHFSEGGMTSILPHPTHYLNMLRIYFMTQPTLSTIRCGLAYQITCKTFAPVQLTSPSDSELKFESVEQTIDRVKHWLKLADAEIVSMETVSVMMYLRNHGIFGPEVTHTWTEMPNATSQTYVLHCVRVYIAGDFHPPSIQELPSVPQVTPYYTTGPPRTISVQRATMTFPPPPSPVKRR